MKTPAGFKYLIPAVVIGLVATFLIHQYISSQTKVAVRATAPVVVAEVDIAPGTLLADRMVKVAQWPQDIIPAGACRDCQQVLGRVSQMPISRGEAVLPAKLAPEGTSAGLGGLLEPNKLAVAVRTDDVIGVAGFINPGDRVDVLVEMQAINTQGEHLSKIILQKIKVLSKGQSIEQTPDKKPEVVTTVTLEVSPEQAEVLNLASSQGKIRLALRNKLNRAEFATSGVLTSTIARGPVAARSVTEAEPAAKPERGQKVEVIKGTVRSETEYYH